MIHNNPKRILIDKTPLGLFIKILGNHISIYSFLLLNVNLNKHLFLL